MAKASTAELNRIGDETSVAVGAALDRTPHRSAAAGRNDQVDDRLEDDRITNERSDCGYECHNGALGATHFGREPELSGSRHPRLIPGKLVIDS